jgi:hypothetical protein
MAKRIDAVRFCLPFLREGLKAALFAAFHGYKGSEEAK